MSFIATFIGGTLHGTIISLSDLPRKYSCMVRKVDSVSEDATPTGNDKRYLSKHVYNLNGTMYVHTLGAVSVYILESIE